MTSAYISEIYASYQGEGPYTGEPQIFLRLAGCPLRCNYCDTPESLTARGHKAMTIETALHKVSALSRAKRIRTVSVTGGEPLAHVHFLKELLPRLKKKWNTYLETAGVHPDALGQVVKYCDVIAMDIKLPSATGQVFWNEHKKFLNVGGAKIFVKVILEKKSKLAEIKKAVALVKGAPGKPRLILQPVTPMPPAIQSPSPDLVSTAYQHASSQLKNVLVMPQQHKLWSVR